MRLNTIDSMRLAAIAIRQAASHSTSPSRSGVKVPNGRTGWEAYLAGLEAQHAMVLGRILDIL
jgi:hypothetical protein